MRRSLVAVPLLLVLALTAACGDDDKDSKGDANPSESTSATTSPSDEESTPAPSESESTSASTTTEPVSAKQFCDDAEAALRGNSTSEVLQQVAIVVANGLPEDMPDDAVAGIQVLIDLAPELEKSALQAFQGLSATQLGNVASLAGYLTTTCGKNLVADLVPALRDLPSELKSMLPSELTAR